MEKVNARLISRRGGRAQVVTYLGEGSQKRSITRHVRLVGETWFGRNPDEASIAYLDAMELAEKSSGEFAKESSDYLAEVESEIKALKEKKATMDVKEYRTIRRKLGEFLKEAVVIANLATALSADDKKAADKARADIPRMVEFSF